MYDYWLEFSQVAIAHLLAVASPGPDFAIVLKQSLVHGRRTAMWTSIGVGTAILLHVTYSLLGLGLLIRSSPLWFSIVKYTGAAYIAWIGVQSLRAKPRAELNGEPLPADNPVCASGAAVTPSISWLPSDSARRSPSIRGAFASGFLTNALNPKASLFFISLFVMIVNPQTPPFIRAGYGLWMAVVTMGWFCLVSVLFTQTDVRRKFLRHGHWIDRALGVVFIGFAVTLALASL
ncbi:MAG: LysE family translocator [Opitutus sp.]|nr:LysE family translocator [Opitutus sp.]